MASIGADAVLLVHFAFVVFAALGVLLVWRWRWLLWLHLPAVAWAAFVEFSGRVCPLTPLEVELRRLAGQTGYGGDFIEHYVGSLLYPTGLTRETQIMLGAAVVLINVAMYAAIARRYWRRPKP
jgi:hypothetical protein